MNDGGPGASYAMHVRFISLPLLMKTSLLPRISARETTEARRRMGREGEGEEKDNKNIHVNVQCGLDRNQFASFPSFFFFFSLSLSSLVFFLSLFV